MSLCGNGLNQFTLKAFADDLKVTQGAKFVLDKTENIVGKEENVGYWHTMFSKGYIFWVIESLALLVKS